ncbi:MAG: hypothetical protein BMS9Abin01_1693 [Gammaproteobacteria bacterium]|nr:MAG: hypothetical protein BMS9Abin01_1693 [Gammaproteobacteria bacterium]
MSTDLDAVWTVSRTPEVLGALPGLVDRLIGAEEESA